MNFLFNFEVSNCCYKLPFFLLINLSAFQEQRIFDEYCFKLKKDTTELKRNVNKTFCNLKVDHFCYYIKVTRVRLRSESEDEHERRIS